MTRIQLHNRSVEQAQQVLISGGFPAQSGGRRAGARQAAARFDLLAEDITIVVRVAKRSTFTWRVSVHGKRYTYRYSGYRWNLHTRGSTKLRPDIWIFAAAESERYFVVSGRRVRGFYTLTLREPSKTWLLAYENRWETIREIMAARQKNAA